MAKSTSKQKLWKAFAEFIRLRDSKNGYGQCISCNKPVAYPNSHGNWHAGHFYPRSTTYGTLYFDERNVNGQCCHCNTYLEGNTEAYRRGLIHKYGEDVIANMDVVRACGMKKMYDYEYDELAKYYRGLVKEMKLKRGIK